MTATRETLIYLGCVLILGASLTGNVVMGQRLRQSPLRMANPQFERGDLTSAIRGRMLDQPTANLAIDSDSLVYVFSSDCSWSVRGYNNVAAIFLKTRGTHKFVGLTTDAQTSLKSGWPSTVPWPIFRVDTTSTPADVLRKLTTTPQLLLVDKTGTVRQRWVGAFFEGRQREVELSFGVQLPGLDPIRPGDRADLKR